MLILEEVLFGDCSVRISQDAFTKEGWNEGEWVCATHNEASGGIRQIMKK